MIKVSVMYPNLDARIAPPVAGVVFTNLFFKCARFSLRQIAVTKRHRGTDGRRCHRQPDRGHYESHHSKFD